MTIEQIQRMISLSEEAFPEHTFGVMIQRNEDGTFGNYLYIDGNFAYMSFSTAPEILGGDDELQIDAQEALEKEVLSQISYIVEKG